MRHLSLVLFLLLLGAATPGTAQVHVGIGISAPGVSIGIDLPSYPRLVRVPDYPVYYAPQVQANYFFYDGLYWVFDADNWYASAWYNGPWSLVGPELVPIYLLRVPVRHYSNPPGYFRGWERKFPNERYPQAEQQPSLHGRNYRYQPREPVVRQLYDERARSPAPTPSKPEKSERGQGHGRDRDDGPGRGNSK